MKAKTKAPDQTFEEVRYLRHLVDTATRVRLKLIDGEELTGTIEFYDAGMIRLTRDKSPNLFVYKHDIKYLAEEPSKVTPKK